MVSAVIVIAWVVIGTAVGLYEVRRGHWRWLWLLGAIAGPFAIPLARLGQEQEPHVRPEVLSESTRQDRLGLHVLAGIDGSPDSLAAARHAAEVLGPRLGQLTLATVVDFETVNVTSPGTLGSEESLEDRQRAEALLADAADSLGRGLAWEPGTVLLAGKPSQALQRYARQIGADLLVVGRRGDGLTKQLLGSCASELARHATVPVLLSPDDAPEARPDDRHRVDLAQPASG